MADTTLSAISNALSLTFQPQIERQWNRSAVTASRIGVKAGGGKSANWDVAFPVGTVSTVAEGSDVQSGEYGSDVNVPATMAWAHYRHPFRITETALDAAASSVGIATALEDLFGERVMAGSEIIAEGINNHIFTGTGTDGSNPTIFGLTGGGGLDTTGTYAGIARGTYASWASNQLANGGTPRALTQDLLGQADQLIFTAAGDVWDSIVCSPGVYRKYENLFTPIQRTDAGQVNLAAGAERMFYKGRPVYRDKACPAGSMIFMSTNKLDARYLPRAGSPVDAVGQRSMNATGTNGEDIKTVTGIPVRFAFLGKTGTSIACMMTVTLQLLVKRPNAFCWIKDISET